MTFCEERTSLTQEYQRLAFEYSDAVGALALTHLPAHEFEQLSAKAEKARHASRSARKALDCHIEEHGCAGTKVAA